MTRYYEEIDNPLADAWIRVGWRQRIEQAYRFEAALEVIGCSSGTVMDVGCGMGSLSDYARMAGIHRDWLGIEPHEPFAREAASKHAVIRARFEDIDPPRQIGCAVAIGTLAGTASRVGPLAVFLASAPTFCLIVLDRDAMDSRAAFAEHRSSSVARDELERLSGEMCLDASVVQLSPTDLALVRQPGPTNALRDVHARYTATIEGPWGVAESPEHKAWLACELGLRDDAAAWLSDVRGSSEFVDLVRARFERLPI